TGSPTWSVAVVAANGLLSADQVMICVVGARGTLNVVPDAPSLSTAALLPELSCTCTAVAPVPGATATTPRKTYSTWPLAGCFLAAGGSVLPPGCFGFEAPAAGTPIAAQSASAAAAVFIVRILRTSVRWNAFG